MTNAEIEIVRRSVDLIGRYLDGEISKDEMIEEIAKLIVLFKGKGVN